MTTLTERYAQVSGSGLRYLIGGQGKPLVLCHGFLSSAEEFGGRFTELAAQRTLIVPDLPGNAESERLPVPHTVRALAASVDGLLKQLGVEDFDLAGLCLGASVACALAGLRSEQVGRLVLHTPLLAPRLVHARYRYQVAAMTLPGVWEAVGWLSRRRIVSDMYKRYVIREGPVDEHTSEVNFRNQRRADLSGSREWLCDALARDDLALIEGRSDPTLMIVAANDQLVDVDKLRRLAEDLPHVSIYVDEDGGHGWNQAAVRRHLSVLQTFFAEGALVTGA